MQYTVYAINNSTGSTENWKSFADKKEAKKYFQQLLSQTIHNIYLYDFINDDLLYFRKNKGQPTSTTPPFRARLAKA